MARRSPPRSARRNPDVALDHMLVDTAAMRLVTGPASFDVLVTENMFGDILTDEAAVLAGSMGMLPSASLGDGGPGPLRAHPRLGAGHRRARGIANPLGTILSAAHAAAPLARASRRRRARIEQAVDAAIAEGAARPTWAGSSPRRAMADEVLRRLR